MLNSSSVLDSRGQIFQKSPPTYDLDAFLIEEETVLNKDFHRITNEYESAKIPIEIITSVIVFPHLSMMITLKNSFSSFIYFVRIRLYKQDKTTTLQNKISSD